MKQKNGSFKYVYFALSLLSLLFMVWAKTYAGETNLPPLKPFVRVVISALYLNLAAGYCLLIKDSALKTPSKWGWTAFALVGALLCFMPPVFSGDLMEYLIRGRMLSVYHLSPYQHVPNEFPTDILSPFSTWREQRDAYGPLFVYLEALPSVFFKDSILGMIALEKMLFLGFLALAIKFFAKIVEAAQGRFTEQPLRLFAFNPLLIVISVIDGRNDIVMVALTLAAFYFLMRKKQTLAFIFWTLSFLVKYMSLLLLPFFIILAVRQKMEEKRGFPFAFIFSQLLINAAIMVFMFLPVWGGRDTFQPLLLAGNWFYNNTIPYAVHQGLGLAKLPVSPLMVKYGAMAGYAAVYLYFLLRFVRRKEHPPRSLFRLFASTYLLYYLVVTIPLGSNVLLWALPWLILAEWPLGLFLTTLYSFVGLFSYFKRFNYLVIIASAVYGLAVFLWNRRLSKKEEQRLA